jgi:alpha-beta hydrolase superfamily lysophospholipase
VSISERELKVSVDELTLSGGVCAVEGAQIGVLLLHGIPSVAPPDPGDEGYPGLARSAAAQGVSAAWLNMRAAKGQPGFFSIEGWVKDATIGVAALTDGDFRDLEVVICGSSAGGAVAAEVVHRGAPVDGLALLAAPAAWLSYAAHPQAGVERITQDSGMRVAPEVLSDPAEWGEEFRRISTETAIAGVRVPVLIVQGEEDFVVPPEHATRISAACPQAEVHMLPGGSHQLRRDPRTLQILLDWLQRTFP